MGGVNFATREVRMKSTTPPGPPLARGGERRSETSRRSRPFLPLFLLATLAVIAVPVFVRMPLTNDAETYDLQADIVRRGGVLYRDALEPNLPGVVWVQLAVRSVFGDSSEALKLFDLRSEERRVGKECRL